MQRIGKISSIATACLVGAAALTGATPAAAAGSIKAAYVEQVIPSKTFSGSMQVFGNPVSVGPGAGILGVTSLVITNYDASPQQVFIFAPLFAGGGGACSDPIVGGSSPHQQIYVQGRSTLQLTYPTPWVFNPVSGITCVAAEVPTALNGGSVEIVVNGVIN